MPIPLGYEPPPPAPPRGTARRRFALVRAWAYALFFTALLAAFALVFLVVLVRSGPSREMFGFAFPFLAFGWGAHSSIRSIVMIWNGRTQSPFQDPPKTPWHRR